MRILALILAAFDWTAVITYIHAHLPQVIVAISVLMYPFLQVLKSYAPTINGWKMVLLNVAIAAITVWAVTPADQVFSIDCLMRIIEASGLAAGIHGTISKLSNPIGNQGKAASVLLCLLGLGLLTGCGAVKTATPATAPSIYQQGAQGLDDFAGDLQSAQNIEKSLYKGGAIPLATHTAIENAFNQIAGYGTQLDALFTAQAAATTITAKINAALASLASIATSAAQLDAATAAQVKGCIQALQQLLTNVLPIFAPGVSAVTNQPAPMEVAFGPRNDRSTGRRGTLSRVPDLQPGQGRTVGEDRRGYAEIGSRNYSRC